MADNSNAPVFADRYRFEPVENDWDRGRSGYTHLVYDLKEKRLGVIKRAEVTSKEATEGLKNEVNVLKALKGLGVPEVYDTGQAVYGSKNYFYMVLEYINGIRVERNLKSLAVVERAEILTYFFKILTRAHQKGVVNGDVDLKHLFWRKDKKELIVIDWGNAKLNIDPNKKTEFAYDLARAGEIIFSLVTRQGHPSATGSIALPDNSALVRGLAPLPVEFRDLCTWAPRTPSDGAKPPHTALELLEASKKWLAAINRPINRLVLFFGIPLLVVAVLAISSVTFKVPVFLFSPTAIFTNSLTSTKLPSAPSSTPELVKTLFPTITQTEIPTQISTVIPSPLTYSPILTFDDRLLPMDLRSCWKNELLTLSGTTTPSISLTPSATATPALKNPEGFYRSFNKDEEGWWIFGVDGKREIEEPVQTDFSPCLVGKSIQAIAINAWVTQIEPESGSTPGSEIGFFIEGQNGQRREYTLWIDKSELMHLRIREGNNDVLDYKILIVKLQHGQGNSSLYDQFLIQIYLKIDDDGSDVLYLLEGFNHPIRGGDFNPSQMIHLNEWIRPTFSDTHKIGLVGRGGSTDILIWPLVFFGR